MDFNSLIAELRASSENLPKDSADRSLLSSGYCNKACNVLDEVAESTDYDTIITGLWLVTAHFAEQLAYLKPVPALSELCFKLFRQCAKAVLNIQWQNLEDDSSLRQNFLASLANLHAKLVPFDFPRFRLLEGLTENPWTNPTLAKVMGGEVEEGDKEEVRTYIEQEDPIILQLRVDMMLQENCEEYALNLCNNCLSHPELQSDLGVRKMQLSLLYKLGQEDKLQEECQKLSIQDAVRIIKQLQTSETHRQICTVLAQTFMVQNWIRPSDMEANKELLRLWIRHQLLVDREQDQFKESVWAMAKLSQSTEQIVIFIDVLREECGEIFLQLYVDMCIFAINVDKGQMETNKKEGNMEAAAARRSDMASICAKLSCLCHHASIKVARICALTSFALKPTEQSFAKIGTFYGQGTDCCNKCGRDRNREPGTINPATLYEVERLLNMLRPDYLSPEQSYTNIQILCRRFLQESLKNAQQLQRQQMIAQHSGITTLVDGPANKLTPAASRPKNVFEALSPQDYHNTQMLLNRMRIQSITHAKAAAPGSPVAQHCYKAGGSGVGQPGESVSPSHPGQANKAQYMFDVEKIKSKQPYGVPVEQQHQYYLMKHEKELEQRRKNAQKKREGKTQQGMTSNPQMQQQMWQQQQQQQQNQQQPQQQEHNEQVSEMIQTGLQDSSTLQKLTQSASPDIVQAMINIMKGSAVKPAAASDLPQQTGTQQMKPLVASPQPGTQPLPTVSTLLKPSVQTQHAQKQPNQGQLPAKQHQSHHPREQSPPRRHPRPQLYAQPIAVSSSSSVAPQRYRPSAVSVVNKNNSSPISSATSPGEKQKGEGFVLAKSHVEDIRRFMQMQMSNLQQKQIAEPRQMSGSTVTLKNASIANSSFGFTNRPKTTVEIAEQAARAKLQKRGNSKPGMFQPSQQLNSNSGQMFMSQQKQPLPKPNQQLQFTPSMDSIHHHHHQQPQHQQKLLQSHHQDDTFSFQNSPSSNMVANPVLPSDELSGSIMGIDDTIIKELLQDSGILANTFPDIEVETVGEDKSKYSMLSQAAIPPVSSQMPKSSNSQLYNYIHPPVSESPYTAQDFPASQHSAQANSIITASTQPQKAASASHQPSVRAINKYSLLPTIPCSVTLSHSALSAHPNPSISRLSDRARGSQRSWAGMKPNANPRENKSFLYNKEMKEELKPTVDQLREIMKKEDIEGEVCMDAANNATYRCIICSIAFETLDHLREHVRNVCKPGLQSSSVYNTKIKQDRANSAKAGVETTTVFQCLRCFELCVSDAGIKQHRLTCKRVPTVPSDLKKDSINKQKVLSKSAITKPPQKKVPKDQDMVPELPLPSSYPSLNTEAVLKSMSLVGSFISQTSDSSIGGSRRQAEVSSSNVISKSTVAAPTPLPVVSNTCAVVSTALPVSSSSTSCLITTSSQPQSHSLSGNIVGQTPACSINITVGASVEDPLVAPDNPAAPAEVVANSASVIERDLETRDTKPVTKKDPEAIPQPSFTEITGSGGSKFYKCGLCSQTLCSHESFLVHWKECAVKNKNLIKKLELKEKACSVKPISGEVLENLIRVIEDVAAGGGSIPETISLDSEFSDVSDYYCLRDPWRAGLLDMEELSDYVDSDFWYDFANSDSQESMFESGADTGETESVTGSGFTDNMDASKDGENEHENEIDEGMKEEDDEMSNQAKRKHLEDTDNEGRSESDQSYVPTRKAPPKLRDRKTLKPIHSFINETFNSHIFKTAIKLPNAGSDEKLKDETEAGNEKLSSGSEIESDGDSLCCKVCRTSFQTKRILLQHYAGKHLQPYTVKTVADSSSYFCHLCQKTYSTFMHYMQHVPNHSVTIYEKMKAFIASRKSQHSQRIAMQRGLAKKGNISPKMAKALKSKKAATKSAVDRLKQQLLAGKTQAVRERLKISKRKRSLRSTFTSSEDDFSSDASNNVVFKSKKSESENREPPATVRPKRSTNQPLHTENAGSLRSSFEQSEEESDDQGRRLAKDRDDDYVLSEEIDSDSMESIAPPTTRSRKRIALGLRLLDLKTETLIENSEPSEGSVDQNENGSGDGPKGLSDAHLADYDADSNCSDLLLSQCQNGQFIPSESKLETQGRSHETGSAAEDVSAVESDKGLIPARTLIVRSLSKKLKERLKSCDLQPTVVLETLQLDVALPLRPEVSCPENTVSQQAQGSSNEVFDHEPAQLDDPTLVKDSTCLPVKTKNSSFLDSFLSYLNQYPSHTAILPSDSKTVQRGRKRCRSGPPRVRGFRKRRRSIDFSHSDERDQSHANLRHSGSLQLDAPQHFSESEASISRAHIDSTDNLQDSVPSILSKFPTRQCSVNLGQKLSLEELTANQDLLSGGQRVTQDKPAISVTAFAGDMTSTDVIKTTDLSSLPEEKHSPSLKRSVKVDVYATTSHVATNETFMSATSEPKPVKYRKHSGGSGAEDTDIALGKAHRQNRQFLACTDNRSTSLTAAVPPQVSSQSMSQYSSTKFRSEFLGSVCSKLGTRKEGPLQSCSFQSKFEESALKESQYFKMLETNRDALMGSEIRSEPRFSDIESSNLVSVDIESSNLVSVDIESSNLVSIDIESSELVSTEIGSSDLVSIDIESSEYVSTEIGSSDLVSIDIESSELVSADIGSSDLVSTDSSSELEPSNLRSLDLMPLESSDHGCTDVRSLDNGSADIRSMDTGSADISSLDTESADKGTSERRDFECQESSRQENVEITDFKSEKQTTDTDFKSEKQATDTDFKSEKQTTDTDFKSEKQTTDTDFKSEKQTTDTDFKSEKQTTDTDFKSEKQTTDTDFKSEKQSTDTDQNAIMTQSNEAISLNGDCSTEIVENLDDVLSDQAVQSSNSAHSSILTNERSVIVADMSDSGGVHCSVISRPSEVSSEVAENVVIHLIEDVEVAEFNAAASCPVDVSCVGTDDSHADGFDDMKACGVHPTPVEVGESPDSSAVIREGASIGVVSCLGEIEQHSSGIVSIDVDLPSQPLEVHPELQGQSHACDSINGKLEKHWIHQDNPSYCISEHTQVIQELEEEQEAVEAKNIEKPVTEEVTDSLEEDYAVEEAVRSLCDTCKSDDKLMGDVAQYNDASLAVVSDSKNMITCGEADTNVTGCMELDALESCSKPVVNSSEIMDSPTSGNVITYDNGDTITGKNDRASQKDAPRSCSVPLVKSSEIMDSPTSENVITYDNGDTVIEKDCSVEQDDALESGSEPIVKSSEHMHPSTSESEGKTLSVTSGQGVGDTVLAVEVHENDQVCDEMPPVGDITKAASITEGAADGEDITKAASITEGAADGEEDMKTPLLENNNVSFMNISPEEITVECTSHSICIDASRTSLAVDTCSPSLDRCAGSPIVVTTACDASIPDSASSLKSCEESLQSESSKERKQCCHPRANFNSSISLAAFIAERLTKEDLEPANVYRKHAHDRASFRVIDEDSPLDICSHRMVTTEVNCVGYTDIISPLSSYTSFKESKKATYVMPVDNDLSESIGHQIDSTMSIRCHEIEAMTPNNAASSDSPPKDVDPLDITSNIDHGVKDHSIKEPVELTDISPTASDLVGGHVNEPVRPACGETLAKPCELDVIDNVKLTNILYNSGLVDYSSSDDEEEISSNCDNYDKEPSAKHGNNKEGTRTKHNHHHEEASTICDNHAFVGNNIISLKKSDESSGLQSDESSLTAEVLITNLTSGSHQVFQADNASDDYNVCNSARQEQALHVGRIENQLFASNQVKEVGTDKPALIAWQSEANGLLGTMIGNNPGGNNSQPQYRKITLANNPGGNNSPSEYRKIAKAGRVVSEEDVSDGHPESLAECMDSMQEEDNSQAFLPMLGHFNKHVTEDSSQGLSPCVRKENLNQAIPVCVKKQNSSKDIPVCVNTENRTQDIHRCVNNINCQSTFPAASTQSNASLALGSCCLETDLSQAGTDCTLQENYMEKRLHDSDSIDNVADIDNVVDDKAAYLSGKSDGQCHRMCSVNDLHGTHESTPALFRMHDGRCQVMSCSGDSLVEPCGLTSSRGCEVGTGQQICSSSGENTAVEKIISSLSGRSHADIRNYTDKETRCAESEAPHRNKCKENVQRQDGSVILHVSKEHLAEEPVTCETTHCELSRASLERDVSHAIPQMAQRRSTNDVDMVKCATSSSEVNEETNVHHLLPEDGCEVFRENIHVNNFDTQSQRSKEKPGEHGRSGTDGFQTVCSEQNVHVIEFDATICEHDVFEEEVQFLSSVDVDSGIVKDESVNATNFATEVILSCCDASGCDSDVKSECKSPLRTDRACTLLEPSVCEEKRQGVTCNATLLQPASSCQNSLENNSGSGTIPRPLSGMGNKMLLDTVDGSWGCIENSENMHLKQISAGEVSDQVFPKLAGSLAVAVTDCEVALDAGVTSQSESKVVADKNQKITSVESICVRNLTSSGNISRLCAEDTSCVEEPPSEAESGPLKKNVQISQCVKPVVKLAFIDRGHNQLKEPSGITPPGMLASSDGAAHVIQPDCTTQSETSCYTSNNNPVGIGNKSDIIYKKTEDVNLDVPFQAGLQTVELDQLAVTGDSDADKNTGCTASIPEIPRGKTSIDHETDDGDDFSDFDLIIEKDTSYRSLVSFPIAVEKRSYSPVPKHSTSSYISKGKITYLPPSAKSCILPSGFTYSKIPTAEGHRSFQGQQVGVTCRKLLDAAKTCRKSRGQFVWEVDDDINSGKAPEPRVAVVALTSSFAARHTVSASEAASDPSLDTLRRKQKALREKSETAPFTWDLDDNADSSISSSRSTIKVRRLTKTNSDIISFDKSGHGRSMAMPGNKIHQQIIPHKRPLTPDVPPGKMPAKFRRTFSVDRQVKSSIHSTGRELKRRGDLLANEATNVTSVKYLQKSTSGSITVDKNISFKKDCLSPRVLITPSTGHQISHTDNLRSASSLLEVKTKRGERTQKRCNVPLPQNVVLHDCKPENSGHVAEEDSLKNQLGLRSRHSSMESNKSDKSVNTKRAADMNSPLPSKRSKKSEEDTSSPKLKKIGLIKITKDSCSPPASTGSDSTAPMTRSSEAAIKAFNQKSLRSRGVNPCPQTAVSSSPTPKHSPQTAHPKSSPETGPRLKSSVSLQKLAQPLTVRLRHCSAESKIESSPKSSVRKLHDNNSVAEAVVRRRSPASPVSSSETSHAKTPVALRSRKSVAEFSRHSQSAVSSSVFHVEPLPRITLTKGAARSHAAVSSRKSETLSSSLISSTAKSKKDRSKHNWTISKDTKLSKGKRHMR